MKIINRETGEEVKIPKVSEMVASGMSVKDAQLRHKKNVLRYIYDGNVFFNYSYAFDNLLKKYGNKKLIPYEMTESQKSRVKNNPNVMLDIPTYYVKGYDKAVSDIKFDTMLATEFYSRFIKGDTSLIPVVNNWNPNYMLEK